MSELLTAEEIAGMPNMACGEQETIRRLKAHIDALTAKPSDHAELIGRLEARASHWYIYALEPGDTVESVLFKEAAAAIRSLTAALSRVEGERDEARRIAAAYAGGSIRVRTHGSALENIAARNLTDDERERLSRATDT